MTTIFKYAAAIAIIILVLFLFLKGCNCNRGKTVTVTKIDTVYAESKKDTTYVPVPYNVIMEREPTKPIIIHDIKYLTDPNTYQPIKIDTAAILSDYYAKAVYSDTQMVQYGKVIIHDTVTKNRISSRHLVTDFNIPVVTKTITTTVYPKEKNKLFFGIDGAYNQGTQTLAVGGSFLFQFKNGFGVQAGAMVDTRSNIIFTAGTKYIISFKHKK